MLMQFVIYVKVIIIVIQPELNSKTFVFAYFRWRLGVMLDAFSQAVLPAVVALHQAVVLVTSARTIRTAVAKGENQHKTAGQTRTAVQRKPSGG